MFDSNDWDDDIFKVHKSGWPPLQNEEHLNIVTSSSHNFEHWESSSFPVMELVVGLVVAAGAVVCVALLCRCCCRKSRGRVLAPPPAPGADGPAPYPQQQYTTATYPSTTVTVYPVGTAAPYPAGAYPGASPYPQGGGYPHAAPAAPYPAGAAAPYPAGAAAPYPAGAAAPYPAVTPYGQAPSAPDANACPPSYDQVMHLSEKQPPFNPNAPH